jgi:uncharacterized protein (DUF4415 family)
MNARKHFGESFSDDPDDAPELLPAFFEDAEIRQGETVIRPPRGPGRPKLEQPKRMVTLRLDADLLGRLRKTGPGWQRRLNDALRAWMDAGAHGDHVSDDRG